MDGFEDQLHNIRTEWNVLKEKCFYGEAVDPVFEGVVKDFCVFDFTMKDVYKKVEIFMKGVDSLAEGLVTLSESTIAGLTHVEDALIKSDSCKMREAANQITRADAPYSAIAKLRRDMDFNIMNPIRNHLINNRNMKINLERRRRQLLEMNIAKKHFDECVRKEMPHTDRRFLQAQSNYESAKMSFHEVDKHIFEWLYILEEYKGDILDSTLQTLKYLQYEFFATSAHAISSVLPARMEFRPMVEMTPEHLEAQVEMELREEEDCNEEEVVTDFSVRLIEKLAKDNKTKPGEGVDSGAAGSGPALPVDPLSLSSLLSQGFEEGPARRALRLHRNDTQAALDWLISGGGDETEKVPDDRVRMPTTVKRVQRLKARRRVQQEKLRKQEEEETEREEEEAARASRKVDEPRHSRRTESSEVTIPENARPPDDLMGFNQPAAPVDGQQPQRAPVDLLNLDDTPPQPTDFSKAIGTLPLPPQRSLDLSKCEKQPLPASLAAGTAVARVCPLSPEQGAKEEMPKAVSIDRGESLAGSGLDLISAAKDLVAKAQITPEQLLLIAQQLSVQPESQQSQVQGAEVFHAATVPSAPTSIGGDRWTGGGLPSMLAGPFDGVAAASTFSTGMAMAERPQQDAPSTPDFQSLDPLMNTGAVQR